MRGTFDVIVLGGGVNGTGVARDAAMRGLRAPLKGARLVVTLPDAIDYEPGSSALDGAAMPDPAIDGRRLVYPLGDLPGEWKKTVTLRARAQERVGAGEHAAVAFVAGAAPAEWQVDAPPSETALRVSVYPCNRSSG